MLFIALTKHAPNAKVDSMEDETGLRDGRHGMAPGPTNGGGSANIHSGEQGLVILARIIARTHRRNIAIAGKANRELDQDPHRHGDSCHSHGGPPEYSRMGKRLEWGESE